MSARQSHGGDDAAPGRTCYVLACQELQSAARLARDTVAGIACERRRDAASVTFGLLPQMYRHAAPSRHP